MRYVILACLLGLTIALDLAVFIASSDEAFESFDPHHPSTLLPIVAGRCRAASVAASQLLRDLLEGFTGPYRERLERTSPPDPPPQ